MGGFGTGMAVGEMHGEKELAEYILKNFKTSEVLQDFLIQIKAGKTTGQLEKKTNEKINGVKEEEKEISSLLPKWLEELDKESQEMVVSRIKQAKALKIGERAQFIVDAMGNKDEVKFKIKKIKLEIEYGGAVIRWKGEIVYYRHLDSIVVFKQEKEGLESFNTCYETAKRAFAEKLGKDFSK